MSKALVLLLCSLLLPVASKEDCRTRKEIRDVTPKQLRDFISTIQSLQTQKSDKDSQYSKWEEWAIFHRSHFEKSHGVDNFLLWHHKFLWDVETEMRKVNPDTVLPYWDWTYDAAKPADSIVMKEDWFGPATSGCVTTGNFAGLRITSPAPDCLQRDFKNGTWLSREELNVLISTATTESSIQVRLEAYPHLVPHVTIGGGMDTLSSPNDPLFFLHHAFLDKTWNDWHKQHEFNSTRTINDKVLERLAANETLHPMHDTICVRYAEPRAILGEQKAKMKSLKRKQKSSTLFSKFIFKTPEPPTEDIAPLPESFLKMRQISAEDATEQLNMINTNRQKLRSSRNI
jgi:tyrosinase